MSERGDACSWAAEVFLPPARLKSGDRRCHGVPQLVRSFCNYPQLVPTSGFCAPLRVFIFQRGLCDGRQLRTGYELQVRVGVSLFRRQAIQQTTNESGDGLCTLLAVCTSCSWCRCSGEASNSASLCLNLSPLVLSPSLSARHGAQGPFTKEDGGH